MSMGHNTAVAQTSEQDALYDDAYIFKEGRSAQKDGHRQMRWWRPAASAQTSEQETWPRGAWTARAHSHAGHSSAGPLTTTGMEPAYCWFL